MMRATSSALTLALILGTAGTALAQNAASRMGHGANTAGPLGVGIQAMLVRDASFGPTVVYDPGVFHVEGILAFSDDANETRFELAGRFWYHINASRAADFSLGGGLGLVTIDPEADVQDSTTDFEIDAGAQLRVFLAPAVALSASLGLSLTVGDHDITALTGDPTGAAGLIYFF